MRKMRIAFLPVNIATLPSTTAAAINRLGLADARVLTVSDSPYWSPNKFTKILTPYKEGWKNPFLKLFSVGQKFFYIIKYILWADAIYWVWDSVLPAQLDLRLIKLLKKPILIEWMGSDIRIPELIFDNNKYYRKSWNEDYTYKEESGERSYFVQNNFAKAGAIPVLSPEMMLYLKPGLFPVKYSYMQRADLRNLPPHYPSLTNNNPIIVHTPSARAAKGTKYVREAIQSLKQKYELEYIELSEVSREEVLNAIAKADIYIDQLIFGNYGLAAIEAMSMGKPVVSYLMDMMVDVLPQDCPIVNANPDNLSEKLSMLLDNPHLRHETGKQGRAYVEKYHDSDKLAYQLMEILNSVKPKVNE